MNRKIIPYQRLFIIILHLTSLLHRKSINYGEDDAYYAKDPQNSYGSITAIKKR